MAEDFTSQLTNFRNKQVQDWPLASTNYSGLNKIQSKGFLVDGFAIKVQFNSERIRSTMAKVDAASIQNRACFLCMDNRPKEQSQLNILPNYELLINPFPIFKQHFTIPHIQHTKQNIGDGVHDFLEISKKMEEMIVFYNGPFCGASAPDHLHFQAIGANEIPLYSWIKKTGILLSEKNDLQVQRASNPFFNVLQFTSKDAKQLSQGIKTALGFMEIKPEHNEPMFNLLCQFKNNIWQVLLIPREKHRPDMFFAEDDDHFGISPASVDLGGVFVLPYLKDFERINEATIQQVFKEVCYSSQKFNDLCNRLKGKLESTLL